MKRLLLALSLLVAGGMSAGCQQSHTSQVGVVYEEPYRPYPYYGRYDKRDFDRNRAWEHDREAWIHDHEAAQRDRDMEHGRAVAHDRD